MADVDALAAELGQLHRGRGVHRPDLAQRIGPELRDVLRIEPDATTEETRRQLYAGLSEAARRLQPKLRLTFVLCSGLGSDLMQLTERMDEVGRQLMLSVRQARRWLRDADRLVAEELIRADADRTPSLAPPGWFIETFDSLVRLDLERPQFSAERQIVITAPRLSEISESISIPQLGQRSDGDLQVTGLYGCTVGKLRRIAPSSWHFVIDLGTTLRAGERHRLNVQITMPSRDYIRPYSVMVPFRTCRSFSTEVHFGTPPVASRAWRMNGIPPVVLEDGIPTRDLYDLESDPVARADFPHIQTGLAYGIQWEWPR